MSVPVCALCGSPAVWLVRMRRHPWLMCCPPCLAYADAVADAAAVAIASAIADADAPASVNH